MALPKPALKFNLLAQCNISKARAGIMSLPHHDVETPVFMPVGTQGTMKGVLPEQLENLNCQIILANTYHLGNRPGTKVLAKAGGLHKFMGWNRGLLTDSGGFQMVSLLKLATITEEGVKFQSPYDNSEIMLTPEHSIEIQNCIGADIIMQLDDVIHATHPVRERIKEATERTSRWLDRCISAHKRPHDQSIFPIVQGSLDPEYREQSAKEHVMKDVNGYAIGGLSGGEAKDDFWPMVHLSTDILPKDKPRYVMGVGVAMDLVVCVALGADMFDCVFPTRTAVNILKTTTIAPSIQQVHKFEIGFIIGELPFELKADQNHIPDNSVSIKCRPTMFLQIKYWFGCALVNTGQLNLKQKKYELDFNPIDKNCTCTTCQKYTRAYLHTIVTVETVACHLLSVHNIAFQLNLMRSMREHIKNGTFPEFVKNFMKDLFPDEDYPKWITDSLLAVNIDLMEKL